MTKSYKVIMKRLGGGIEIRTISAKTSEHALDKAGRMFPELIPITVRRSEETK